MLQIITYLLCLYLVFKGIEIFQIGLASTRENRTALMYVGVLSLAGSVACAIVFALWITDHVNAMPSSPFTQ